MEIHGYKSFDIKKTNEYGRTFEEGQTYTCSDNDLIFGHGGHGFHFCKCIEDCLLYFSHENRLVAKVTGLEEVRETDDDITDSFGICIARKIRIDKFLTREEIVEEFLHKTKYLPDHRVSKFLRLMPLTPQEIEYFKIEFCNSIRVIQDIWYYQEGDKNAYSKPFDETEKQIQLIKTRAKKQMSSNE